MKKEYISPELEITKFDITASLLATADSNEEIPGYGDDLD